MPDNPTQRFYDRISHAYDMIADGGGWHKICSQSPSWRLKVNYHPLELSVATLRFIQGNTMKKSILCSGLAAVLSFAFIGCDVEQTREGELPNVEVEGGQMPGYDVDAPDVDVTTEKERVTVPDIDVDMEEKTIDVPKVDIDLPEDN